MSEFDLIPESYRQRLAGQRLLRFGAVGATALVLVVVGSALLLNRWVESVRAEVAELERQQAITARQRDTIASLGREKKALEQQWQLLEGLRSGMPAKALMESVQAALRGNDVWFVDWRLRRAGIVTERETAPNQPGYFIIVKRQGNPEDWRSQTHMTVKGQARDHARLSEFAQRLLRQPNVEDVRVQRTSQRYGRDQLAGAVDFDLAIVFRSATESS